MTTELRREAVPTTFAVAGTLLLLALFLTRFEPALQLLIDVSRPAVAALVVLLATAGCGQLIRFRRLSDSVAAGFAVFGTLCAVVSLVDTRLLVPLTVLCAAAGAFALGRNGVSFSFPRPPILLVVPALVALACAIAPVNSPDELVYKLAIPHEWLMHGRMVELPLASNSYLVMALQCTSMAAMALGGGVAAKLASFGLWIAAIAIIRRVGGDFAAVAISWTPALMIVAGWAWSEWGVIALLVLSWERWAEGDDRGAAIALGLAAAAKYTALPWILAFGVLLLLKKRDAVLRTMLLVFLFGAFFYARNTAWTGSPFAPLFLPHAPAVQAYRGSGWAGLLEGVDVFDARIADESLGMILPLCAIAGLFAWKSRRDLVLLGLIQMPILLTIAPGSRNIINGVVPLALAGALLLEERVLGSKVARVCIGIALAAQLVLVAYVLESYEIVPYLAGKESATAYLVRTRNFVRPYDWIARSTPRTSRVLLLGENRTYYLEREFVAGSNLDGPRIASWLGTFANSEAMRAGLQRMHITHVLVHVPWYRVGDAPQGTIEKEYLLQVPPRTHAVLMQFLSTQTTPVYADGEYRIYALNGPSAPAGR